MARHVSRRSEPYLDRSRAADAALRPTKSQGVAGLHTADRHVDGERRHDLDRAARRVASPMVLKVPKLATCFARDREPHGIGAAKAAARKSTRMPSRMSDSEKVKVRQNTNQIRIL